MHVCCFRCDNEFVYANRERLQLQEEEREFAETSAQEKKEKTKKVYYIIIVIMRLWVFSFSLRVYTVVCIMCTIDFGKVWD